MKNILKKAWNEFACDFFVYDAFLNIVLVLLLLVAVAGEFVFACGGASLSMIIFNPFSLLILLVLGSFGYQYVKLVFKVAENV